MTNPKLAAFSDDGERYYLYSAEAMPNASTFLWNKHMLVQLNCRGFVTAQHMQLEPAKYSHGPMLEQRTFMQPEQPYYAHHPGRFVYVKDESDGHLFSAPHEPVRARDSAFEFCAGQSNVRWRTVNHGVAVGLSLHLPVDDAVELWRTVIENTSDTTRRLSVYPSFTIGYMSWMNQSAQYRADLGGIIARSVTPYQKLEDYERIRALKDCTFLLHDTQPDAWEASLRAFEGEGGLHAPDSITAEMLGDGNAIYETPIASLQYRLTLRPGERREFRFLFGPANIHSDINALRERYLTGDGFETALREHETYVTDGQGCTTIQTPNTTLDHFVNHWLTRQVFYHGEINRLTNNPQTRNYLQDAMGMVFIKPNTTRIAILRALSQQNADGSMPDGILLTPDATPQYINQIPHTDHCVWLPICLQAYLDETGDIGLLDEIVEGYSVSARVTQAMYWLTENRDDRGLSLIDQGDWCDPMNMAGHKGRGISGWLSIATVHAQNLWADICDQSGRTVIADAMRHTANEGATAAQTHLWDGDWFARGISDADRPFGVSSDIEGRIYLNPQTWAMLSGIATSEQCDQINMAIHKHLATPYGATMLAPSYTRMVEDVGRITQKHPGTAENGSVYNHAAMFYAWALYQRGDSERAFRQLQLALPGPDEDDLRQRGQLPVFMANYYRGAHKEYPRTAGRSSQLFHTGGASWFYRIIVEQLFGLQGCVDGLRVAPQLPQAWKTAKARRRFRGAQFDIHYERDTGGAAISVDGQPIDGDVISGIEADRRYQVIVSLPLSRS